MDSTLRQISQSLSELDSYDSDLRFMALNDIHKILQDDYTTRFLASQRVLSRVSNGILTALQDQNTEVQNQAVKALGPLVVIYEGEARNILTQLLKSDSAVKDLAIRAVVTNVPNTTENREIIISMILPVIKDNKEPSIDSTDVLIELVRGYGAGLSPANINTILDSTRVIAKNPSGLISKRAFDIFQDLAPLASDEVLAEIINFTSDFEHQPSRFKIAALTMLRNLVIALPARFDDCSRLVQLATHHSSTVDEEATDVAEAAIGLLHALVLKQKVQPEAVAPTVAESIAYNPNLGDGVDDEMNDYSDFDADSEIEEEFDDDTEDSWKIRRMATRVVAAMLLAGNFSAAADFVTQLVHVLATEPNDAVKQEILAVFCLLADPPQPSAPAARRRNSDTSMMIHDNVLTDHIPRIIQLAKADAEHPAYLQLISKLYKNYTVPNTQEIVAICTKRIENYKSQQILECLEVIKSVLTFTTDFETNEILAIIHTGLNQSLFKVQSLALENARLLNSQELLENVEKRIEDGVSVTIRAASLETAASIIKSHLETAPLDNFVQLANRVLQSDPEQRSNTLIHLVSLFKAGAKVSEKTLEALTTQVLDLFSTTSPSLTCSCLELIDLIFSKQTAESIAEKILKLPNSPEFIDLKCKTLCHVPNYPGVLEFALKTTELKKYPSIKLPHKGAQQSPLIMLFAEITKAVPGVLQKVSQAYTQDLIWAEVIAEVIFTSDSPTPPLNSPITNWYISVALFLTLHGRQVFDGEFDTTGIDPILAGYCIGATTLQNGTSEKFLHNASTQIAEKPEVVLSAVEVIISRENLSPEAVEKAWEAAELLTSQNFSQKEGLEILARVIGALYVETNNSARFSQWDDTPLGITAAKAAFSQTKSEDQQVYLIEKFIQAVSASDINARSAAAKSLAWITQIQPTVVEPYTDEIMKNALKSTEKDMSLVRLAQIGPYKHEIDDGLDFRKASYELIYLCISNFPSISTSGDVWTPVLRGLAEKEDHDIKMLVCLIIQLIAEKDICTIVAHLSEIMKLFTCTHSLVVKETGIKLEHDKKATITRQIKICTKAIREGIENAKISDSAIRNLITPEKS